MINEIGLDQNYVTTAKVELDRMGKEIRFRKNDDEIKKKEKEEADKKKAKTANKK